MKRKYLQFLTVLLLFTSPIHAQNQQGQVNKSVDAAPNVPRVSAYEAYQKYKAGKALLIQAGGATFKNRHILGALDIEEEALRRGKIVLPPLPKSGIEIFTYCY